MMYLRDRYLSLIFVEVIMFHQIYVNSAVFDSILGNQTDILTLKKNDSLKTGDKIIIHEKRGGRLFWGKSPFTDRFVTVECTGLALRYRKCPPWLGKMCIRIKVLRKEMCA